MAIPKYEIPPPNPTWPLEEMQKWEKLTDSAKVITGKLGVKPSEYFATLEVEKIQRRAQGLPPLPA